MLKAVIFDMDGVIVNSEPVYEKVELEIFRQLGIDISVSERYAYVGMKTDDMWEVIKQRFAVQQTVEELTRLEAEKFREHIKINGGIHPIPGAVELIKELHREGMALAVASSALKEDVYAIIETLDLDRYFSYKVSGCDVENGKPAPDIFLRAVELLGLKPEECVVIEDSENGVRAARAAGIKCVGLKNKGSGIQDLSAADLVVDSLLQLDYSKLKRLCE